MKNNQVKTSIMIYFIPVQFLLKTFQVSYFIIIKPTGMTLLV